MMFRGRQYLIFIFLISLFVFLLGRLFYLQVLNYGRFSDMASGQHFKVMEIPPRRGVIYDRYMEPLAINLEMPSVFADPRSMTDRSGAAEKLSSILDMDRGDLMRRFERDKAFVWVKRKISTEKAKEIREADITGIHFLDESKRNYPNDSMACHVLGFVGMDNRGLEGLELKLDEKLKGKPGWKQLMRDARRRTVLFDEKGSMPAQNGYNVVLTIDSVIQFIVEEEIAAMCRKYNAESGSAIVMDPYTGQVLAMANYPSYDLNAFSQTPRSYMKNRAIASVFEPGSVFKVVTAAAVINEGAVSLDDEFDCENGEYNVAGRILHDYHGYGNISFREVIARSSNIGTVKAAFKIGEEGLYRYIKALGFGERTGIDLKGEVRGISRHPKIWSRSDITTIPIGQGIAVTPLQLACAVSAIANGGDLMRPYIVDKITTWEGVTYRENVPEVRRNVLDEDTCRKVTEAMRLVVEKGTGRRAASDIYTMCGKTGTAQMVDPSGGYYPDKYDATFVGFAPADDPSIVLVVTAEDPHPVYFGGSVAGPAFKEIAERTLQYLGSSKAEEKPLEEEVERYGI